MPNSSEMSDGSHLVVSSRIKRTRMTVKEKGPEKPDLGEYATSHEIASVSQ